MNITGIPGETTPLFEIRKRDGRIVSFETERFIAAVRRAMKASGKGDPEHDPGKVALKVLTDLAGRYEAGHIPEVEEIPVKAPEGSVIRKELSALEQLQHWRMVKEHYTEHNPSVTVTVCENEWIETGQPALQQLEDCGEGDFFSAGRTDRL